MYTFETADIVIYCIIMIHSFERFFIRLIILLFSIWINFTLNAWYFFFLISSIKLFAAKINKPHSVDQNYEIFRLYWLITSGCHLHIIIMFVALLWSNILNIKFNCAFVSANWLLFWHFLCRFVSIFVFIFIF